MYRRAVLSGMVAIVSSLSIQAEPGIAVAGSFLQLDNALSAQQALQPKFDAQLHVAQTEVDSQRWYRVQAASSDARALVAKMRLAGINGAFFQPVAHASTRSNRSLSSSAMALANQKSDTTSRKHLPISNTPARSGAGPQEVKGVLNGMPMHYIPLNTRSHSEINITVDGVVNEPIWSQIPHYDNMRVAIPGTGEPASYPSEIRLLATDRGLYVSAVLYQPADSLVSRLSERDEFIDRDNFGVTLDTTGNALFGYWFMMGLGGSLGDGKVLPERRYSRSWDGPWIGKTSTFDGGWMAEMYFPWSMMSLPKTEGRRNIGFAATRQVAHANQRYQWPGHSYSASQFVSALNTLQVEGVEPRQQFSIIPYASTTADAAREETEAQIGVDVSWKPSPKLEITGSVIPDFGAVESDRVVLNLTAMETFFEEKRLFFLEGNEVFETTPRSDMQVSMVMLTNEDWSTSSRRVFMSDFVPMPISIVNTRRIGGTANQVSYPEGVTPLTGERDLPTELLGAAKFTGAIGNFRYGVLSAFEDDVEWSATNSTGAEVNIEAAGRDFGVARMVYEAGTTNRYSIGYIGTHTGGPLYNAQVHGLDAHYSTGNGRWITDFQLMRSDVDERAGSGALVDILFAPSPTRQHKFELEYFDDKINLNDLGFQRRNAYSGAQYIFRYANANKRGFIVSTRGTVALRQHYNDQGQVIDSGIYWRNILALPKRNTVRTGFGFMPRRWEDMDSRGNGAYRVAERLWWSLIWSTDASKTFSYSFGASGEQENLGDWTDGLSAAVTIRPSDRIFVDIEVDYKRRDGWVVYQGERNFGSYHGADWQPRVKFNWFMAPQHQLRLMLQWAGVRADERGFFSIPEGGGSLVPAEQSLDSHDFTVSLLTTQLRYRWEIAPLTDFFLVYNRGNTLPNQIEKPIADLFQDAFQDPIVDSLVAKFRYRFGN
ncbi:MAG: DUF5916 domain-containing protein [Pseudomonadales bacterium]|nr:DUF5916 domain-containing protein [Pseudomonadales bacterium]